MMKLPTFWMVLALLNTTTCFSMAQTPSGSETGVEGVITIGPIKPGPIKIDTPSSKPLADIAFTAQSEGMKVIAFTTDDRGRFRILLEPGHYIISRQGPKSAAGYFGPFNIDVIAGKMTKVEWQCDSGMR